MWMALYEYGEKDTESSSMGFGSVLASICITCHLTLHLRLYQESNELLLGCASLANKFTEEVTNYMCLLICSFYRCLSVKTRCKLEQMTLFQSLILD